MMTGAGPGRLYVGIMLVAGFGVGTAQALLPDAAVWQLPPLLWLLAASLLIDIMLNQRATAEGAPPLTMPWRVGGFLAGALVSIVLPLAAGAAR